MIEAPVQEAVRGLPIPGVEADVQQASWVLFLVDSCAQPLHSVSLKRLWGPAARAASCWAVQAAYMPALHGVTFADSSVQHAHSASNSVSSRAEGGQCAGLGGGADGALPDAHHQQAADHARGQRRVGQSAPAAARLRARAAVGHEGGRVLGLPGHQAARTHTAGVPL